MARAIVDKLDEIPESLRPEYEERDGKFVLKIDGSPFGYVRSQEHQEVAAKLAEFRENNRGLNALKEELQTKLKSFDGIDPVEYKALKTRIAELESQGVKGAPDVAAIVRQAVDQAVNPVKAELEAMKQQKVDAELRAAQQTLRSTFTEQATKAGVDEKAITDYISRGMQVFQYVDGKIVARNGDTPVFSRSRPGETLTIEEWTKDLANDAPHLFKPSRGAGSQNGTTGAVGGKQRKFIGNDPLEFGRNLESIAKGETVVRVGE